MVQFRNEDEKGERSLEESTVLTEAFNKRVAKVTPVEDDNITRLAALAVVAIGVALVEAELLVGVALGAAAMVAPQIIKAFGSGNNKRKNRLSKRGRTRSAPRRRLLALRS